MDTKNVSSSNYLMHMLLAFIENTFLPQHSLSFNFLLGIRVLFRFALMASYRGVLDRGCLTLVLLAFLDPCLNPLKKKKMKSCTAAPWSSSTMSKHNEHLTFFLPFCESHPFTCFLLKIESSGSIYKTTLGG